MYYHLNMMLMTWFSSLLGCNTEGVTVGGNKNELANGRLCRDVLNEMHDERCGAGAMLRHGDL